MVLATVREYSISAYCPMTFKVYHNSLIFASKLCTIFDHQKKKAEFFDFIPQKFNFSFVYKSYPQILAK